MHVDETSLRVDKKNHWIHVYSAGVRISVIVTGCFGLS
jgi:hypothetical protein